MTRQPTRLLAEGPWWTTANPLASVYHFPSQDEACVECNQPPERHHAPAGVQRSHVDCPAPTTTRGNNMKFDDDQVEAVGQLWREHLNALPNSHVRCECLGCQMARILGFNLTGVDDRPPSPLSNPQGPGLTVKGFRLRGRDE